MSKRNDEQSPVTLVSIKKNWSTRDDDESSITNSAIFQAKSIESFDVTFDSIDSISQQGGVIFDIQPDQEALKNNSTMESSKFEYFTTHNPFLEESETKKSIVRNSPFTQGFLTDSLALSSFNKCNSKRPSLHIDTATFEEEPSEDDVTPKSSNNSTPHKAKATNMNVDGIVGAVARNKLESLNQAESSRCFKNDDNISQVLNTYANRHKILENENSFGDVIASILPHLCNLEQRDQASILNLLLDELHKRRPPPIVDSNKNGQNLVTENGIPDFSFAQQQRRQKYQNVYSWALLGLFEYLEGVRIDYNWAYDAIERRKMNEPYVPWSYYDLENYRMEFAPIFTTSLLCILTATLIASYGLNDWNIELFEINPMLGPGTETFIKMGAKKTSLIVNGKEWFRLFSSSFLSAGMIQYALNLMALSFAASPLERYLGFLLTSLLFLVTSIGGTILSTTFNPHYVTVSSNGGVCGILGFCDAFIVMNISSLFRNKLLTFDRALFWKHVRVTTLLISLTITQIIIGFCPFMDNITNFGGLVYGFLLGMFFAQRSSKSTEKKIWWKTWNITKKYFSLLLCILLILASAILLDFYMNGTNVKSYCNSCDYLTCLSFPTWKKDKWWYCDDCAYSVAYPTMNSTLNIYDEIILECPNQSKIEIDISSLLINEEEILEESVPTFCRKHCDSAFT